MPEYLLPDVGEGLTEAEIVTWKVKVGDVDRDQRHRRRDRDRQVAGRAAVAVRRHGDRAARAPRARRSPVGTPIIAIGDAGRRPAARRPSAAGRTEIDLSNPAASGGGEGE